MLKITPTEMHELVTDQAAHWWKLFRFQFPKLSSEIPLIRYSGRLKTTAGLAYYDKGYIVLSTEMMWQHGDNLLQWVVPHEFGHIVAYRLFNEPGHGPQWKHVMRAVGASDARCHTFVNHLHEMRKLVRMA